MICFTITGRRMARMTRVVVVTLWLAMMMMRMCWMLMLLHRTSQAGG